MSTSNTWDNVRAIAFDNFTLTLLDQRALPQQETYINYTNAHDVAHAITDMVVRGAPAIGITAAYGIVLAAYSQRHQQALELSETFEQLANSRPTAVNLFWALEKMKQTLSDSENLDIAQKIEALLAQAKDIHKQDIVNNQIMGKLGASLIEKDSDIYTHCNAGALATGGFGTALGVIRCAVADGKVNQVYAGETRPWLQGARLTTWELMRDNIPVCLSSEGAAGQLMRQGKIKWIIVGADRIAANGDVANKIGTYNLAVLAKHHNVKFMVVAPCSTFDLKIQNGHEIPIEDRSANEVTHIQGKQIAPENCAAINPSFDVTPNELIDAIICEKGILQAPFTQSISEMVLN